MRYTKTGLEIKLLKLFNQKKDRHKNMYNILGRGLLNSPGSLEYQLQTTFTESEPVLCRTSNKQT